jgi:hypothetical protein
MYAPLQHAVDDALRVQCRLRSSAVIFRQLLVVVGSVRRKRGTSQVSLSSHANPKEGRRAPHDDTLCVHTNYEMCSPRPPPFLHG